MQLLKLKPVVKRVYVAKKPETKFHDAIHKNLPKYVYRMKNNNPYIGGIPDCWYSYNRDMWIEYKWMPRDRVRGTVSVVKMFQPLQESWIRSRHEEGRTVAVIVGCPSGGVVFPGVTWEEELTASEFNSRVQSRTQLAEWILTQVT